MDSALNKVLPSFWGPFVLENEMIGIDNMVKYNKRKLTLDDTESRLKEFGKDICFWGGGCSNKILEEGTPEDIRKEVKKRIEDFAPGGGFVFGSIHCIQPFMPPENIVALFDSAYEYGAYPIIFN